MAEEKKGGSAADDALWFFGILAALIALWYFSGGPGRADLRGLFLAPPDPLGSGEAYGPTFGEDYAPASTSTFEAPPPLPAETY